jgi:ankyrin repeat protein
MKIVFFFLFIFSITFAQKDVFAVSRNGSLLELIELQKLDSNCINNINENGYSTLILAIYSNNLEVANYLLQNVKNINYLSKSGSALMAAVIKENYEFTKQLIEKKANLDFQDSNGQTALIMAINTNNVPIIELLISAKANVKIKDNYNKEALDYALKTNNQKIIKLLNY